MSDSRYWDKPKWSQLFRYIDRESGKILGGVEEGYDGTDWRAWTHTAPQRHLGHFTTKAHAVAAVESACIDTLQSAGKGGE